MQLRMTMNESSTVNTMRNLTRKNSRLFRRPTLRDTAGFTLTELHAEGHKWLSETSKYPVQFSFFFTKNFDAAGRLDFQWFKDRTGYILFR